MNTYKLKIEKFTIKRIHIIKNTKNAIKVFDSNLLT